MNGDAIPQVSIVVACHNEKAHIGPFIASLLAQQMGGMRWEVLIADGMSGDGTRGILEDWRRHCRYLHVLDNPGRIVSTGLNRAIRMSRGNVILRMDAHTRYAPDYCRRCLTALSESGADNVGGPARTTCHGLRGRAIAAAFHSRFSTGGGRFHDEDFQGWVDTVPYGCWRRSTLDRVGLFDEELVRNQDDELNLRLIRAGGKIWQSPAIVSWYSPRSTLAGLFRQYFQYGFWKVAVIRKHRTPASWRHLVPAGFVLANALLIGGAAIAAWGTAGQLTEILLALWFGLLAIYVCANVMASALAARRNGWATLLYLPAVFAAYHLSYGLGFLAGLAASPWRSRWAGWRVPLLTGYTR